MKNFSSTGQLVTLGLVDRSIGAMAKGLVLVNMKVLIAKELLCSNLICHLRICSTSEFYLKHTNLALFHLAM